MYLWNCLTYDSGRRRWFILLNTDMRWGSPVNLWLMVHHYLLILIQPIEVSLLVESWLIGAFAGDSPLYIQDFVCKWQVQICFFFPTTEPRARSHHCVDNQTIFQMKQARLLVQCLVRQCCHLVSNTANSFMTHWFLSWQDHFHCYK